MTEPEQTTDKMHLCCDVGLIVRTKSTFAVPPTQTINGRFLFILLEAIPANADG